MVATQVRVLKNFVGGKWVDPQSSEKLDVLNPSNGEVIAQVPLSSAADVDAAVAAAQRAFPAWRNTPAVERIGYLFKLRELMVEHADELARIICTEEGKTWEDAKGEVVRATQNVEVATGIPSLLMGYGLEDISRGIDEEVVRTPLGVAACIAPFNFPLMVPCWFFPYAIACGNTYVVKPSEQVPLSMYRLFELVQETGLPDGVLNLINGSRDAVNGILQSPGIKAVSFVGSTPTAKYVYTEATKHGKRAQCQGGAKNFMIVMPDAPMKATVDAIMGSSFGAAGERCLAGSVVIPVGEVAEPLVQNVIAEARKLRLGDPTDPETGLGPLISSPHRDRVRGHVDKAEQEGASIRLDGRGEDAGAPKGSFFGPTVLDNVTPAHTSAQEEIFGPVLSVIRVNTFDDAIKIINASPYGNAASIFTSNGHYARQFKHDVDAGNIGVNVGVAAPMAFFPFAGMKQSFFGDLHGQGRDAVEFFTEKKVVIERWPTE
jgi:malonate-semialdehyde dehydrogenase (acetylating)/methylmalonate-semialdehyde dehydrogenase